MDVLVNDDTSFLDLERVLTPREERAILKVAAGHGLDYGIERDLAPADVEVARAIDRTPRLIDRASILNAHVDVQRLPGDDGGTTAVLVRRNS